MSSNRRVNGSSSGQRGRHVSNETRTRVIFSTGLTNKRKKLIELFDHAISMNNYTMKDPTALGRMYMAEIFDHAFNMNITYSIFKNKLDELKKDTRCGNF